MTQDVPIDPKQTSNIRRSKGEWESGKSDANPSTSTQKSPKKAAPTGNEKLNPKKTLSQDSMAPARRPSTETAGCSPQQQQTKYADRLTEARACVTKAKLHLGSSRHIKTEIKIEVTQIIERLYQLVKEAESAKGVAKKKASEPEKEPEKHKKPTKSKEIEGIELLKKLEEQVKMIDKNNEMMEKLKESLERHQEVLERKTYASVAAAGNTRLPQEQTALHSVVVTSKDEKETGEEVLERIRQVVNAKEGGIVVDKIRKAKDRKVIVGCRTEEERRKVQERLGRAAQHLSVEEYLEHNLPFLQVLGICDANCTALVYSYSYLKKKEE